MTIACYIDTSLTMLISTFKDMKMINAKLDSIKIFDIFNSMIPTFVLICFVFTFS